MTVAPSPQVALLPQTPQLKSLMSVIRSKETVRADFIFYSDRIIRLLIEEGNDDDELTPNHPFLLNPSAHT